MRELRRDFLGTISRANRELGGLACISAGPPGWNITAYSVTSPELAAEILGQPDRFRKNGPGYRELRQALGENLLTSEDESWHRQRRFLAPIFTRRRIARDYNHIMIEEAELLVERWRVAASQGQSVDLYPEMVGVTSRIIGRILFGADVSRALPELTRFSIVNEELLRRAVSPHPMPRWLPTSHNRRLTRELAQVRDIVDEIISIRQSEPPKGSADDMLGRLLAARDAENAADRLSETEVTNQVLLFLIAGRETNSNDARLHTRPARPHAGVADEAARRDHRATTRTSADSRRHRAAGMDRPLLAGMHAPLSWCLRDEPEHPRR